MPGSNEADETDWLSLQEASDRLGVAPSTVRRWGDAGRVPTKRTLGGHRRFQRTAIERLRGAPQGGDPPVSSATRSWSIDTRDLMQQDWHSHFESSPATERMRGLGQRLFGMLMQYINGSEPDTRLLNDARGVGAAYGDESRRLGVSMHDTVEAFLFFRRAFAKLAKPQSTKPVDVAAVIELRTRLDRFMDEILLGTIEGHERAAAGE